MDELQRYLFDVNGYIVIHDALEHDVVAALNQAIDNNLERVAESEHSLSAGSEKLLGSRRLEFDDSMSWPDPDGVVFRDVLSSTPIMELMVHLLGDGFRFDSMKGTIMRPGTEGFFLHGGGGDADSLALYRVVNGMIRNTLVAVSYALSDVKEGDGGFVCIPGSHKAEFRCPRAVTRLEMGSDAVKQIPLEAGSAVVFSEALMHGTRPWAGSHDRRTLFVRYAPGAMSFRSDPMPPGYDSYAEKLTPLQRALLEPPHYRERPSIANLLALDRG